MPGTYAAATDVSTSRSRDEIERTLMRFGASGFAYFSQPPHVSIAFEIRGLRVLMKMHLPPRSDFLTTTNGRSRPTSAIDKDHEQACRQRWRTLANGIKAKLAMIDDGISTIEREFLADVVMPDGNTIGDHIAGDLRAVVQSGSLPSLMPGLPAPRVIAIGERS